MMIEKNNMKINNRKKTDSEKIKGDLSHANHPNRVLEFLKSFMTIGVTFRKSKENNEPTKRNFRSYLDTLSHILIRYASSLRRGIPATPVLSGAPAWFLAHRGCG